MAHISDLAIDDKGQIDVDLSCRACGYNLRGRRPDERCPECATIVGRSIHGDRLAYSDPAWVQRLPKGITLILIGIVFGMVLGIVMGFGIAFAATLYPQAWSWMLAGILGVSVASGVTTYVGLWFVTTPDPGAPDASSTEKLRQIARWCVAANALSAPMQLYNTPTGGFTAAPAQALG